MAEFTIAVRANRRRTIACTGAGGRVGFKWKVITAGPVMRNVRRHRPVSIGNCMIRLALLLLLLILIIGCARPRPKLSDNSPPQSSATIINDLTQKLLAMPASSDLTIPSASQATETFEVPSLETLASDGRRLTLSVDRRSGTAWISSSGGIGNHLSGTFGPWHCDHPTVAQLLHEINHYGVSSKNEKSD
jgi:hypothetical protein